VATSVSPGSCWARRPASRSSPTGRAAGRRRHRDPFLRYLPERFSPLGGRLERILREQLAEAPSFVAFEGYDTIAVLAEALHSRPGSRAPAVGFWPGVTVEGTRGRIRVCRTPGISVWQWTWPPVQVADRDPADPGRFRILSAP
jgi:hypothetical protein